MTTSIVPMPPPTTASTGPKIAAASPDSKPPSWLELPTKTLLTAEILPRISSGVRSKMRVLRTTTLILSSAPSTPSIKKERGKHCETPKTDSRNTESGYGQEQRPAGFLKRRQMGKTERHHDRADRGSGAQPAKTDGSHMENVLGIDRQQR